MEIRRSETFGKLTKALADAQKDFSQVVKSRTNEYGQKYSELSDLIKATRPALNAQGLAIIQAPRVIQSRAVEVATLLVHESNEFMGFDLHLPAYKETREGVRFDGQTISAAITIGRRQSYAAILCIAGEEDDDGKSLASDAVPDSTVAVPAKPLATVSTMDSQPKISTAENNSFWSACRKTGKSSEAITAFISSLGVTESSEIPKAKYSAALSWALEAA